MDWTRYRDQWEYAHAVNAFIKIIGLSLLVISVIVQYFGQFLKRDAIAIQHRIEKSECNLNPKQTEKKALFSVKL